MNVGELKTLLREDYLDDPNTEYLWSEAFLLRSLNEAERQACNRMNLIYDDSTASITQITLVNGTASYTLSPKITYIENVLWEGKPVAHKTKEEMDRLSATWRTDTGMTGKEVNRVHRGRSIRFSPIPDATDAGSKVYLEVYRLPSTDLADNNSVPEIASDFHRFLIFWVLYEGYSKRDAETYDPEKAQFHLAMFDSIFGNQISAEVRFNQFEQPKSLTLRPIKYTGSLHLNRDDDFGDF